MKIEVLVADDHAIIRDGLKKILDDTDDLVVAGEASDGNQTLDKVREREWGLLILDLSMQGRNGLDLIKRIRVERPKLPILIFSMHPEEQYALRALRCGASGYLSKEADGDLLLPVMRKVAGGGTYFSNKVAELLLLEASRDVNRPPHLTLSDREYEIFTRIVQGTSLTEIAAELSLSIKTVSTHKSHILGKMGMSNHVDLVRYAIEHHLLEVSRN
ncbi:response regulator [Uliginosibacterium gangwonense]|uniref:response regulator n=1 Tax=Uliginosibacterium gangwonense TaxID=392736 RepID=UPI00035D7EAA|nr:response regulator transcription factor [Uliginosibacterium gangwonense]